MKPGQPGTKKWLEKYGEDSYCVRYRYDDSRKQKIITVALIVKEGDWEENSGKTANILTKKDRKRCQIPENVKILAKSVNNGIRSVNYTLRILSFCRDKFSRNTAEHFLTLHPCFRTKPTGW